MLTSMFTSFPSCHVVAEPSRSSCRILFWVITTSLLLNSGRAATFTVRNTNDAGPSSLRQAMLDANTSSGLDTIAFDIDGPGVHTIRPLSELPRLVEPTVIDGSTQPGYADEPLVELNGDSAGPVNGFWLETGSDGSTVRALVVNGFSGSALVITSSRNTIVGNYIGTSADGSSTSPNSLGALEISRAEENVIVGNILQTSIDLFDAPRTVIAGNLIGINRAGTAAIGPISELFVGGDSNFTTIGGVSPSERNVIVASIAVHGGTGCVIVGNNIGTDITGRVALATVGISLKGRGHRVGGSTASHRNVISGGIRFYEGSDHEIQGNFIGVAADGVTPISQGGGRIEFFNESISTITIGDVPGGSGNVIDGSLSHAIGVTPLSTRVKIRGNSMIRTRARVGIDLNRDGETPNDRGDADSGANMLQNHPLLSGTSQDGETVLNGTLDSTPSTTFLIDFYTNTDFASGLNRIDWTATTTATTDATGVGTFVFRTSAPLHTISATATDPQGNSSEFSPPPTDVTAIPTMTINSLFFLAIALSAVAVVTLRQ